MFIKSVKVTREYITNEYNFKKIKNGLFGWSQEHVLVNENFGM